MPKIGIGITKKIEVAANIAIIIVALALVISLIQRFRQSQSNQSFPIMTDKTKPTPGSRITLKGIDWSASKQTLLLVLSKGCEFCSSSADFYRTIINNPKASGNTTIVAVWPQDPISARMYLDELRVPVQKIISSPLSVIGIPGTPALILADNRGTVIKLWMGKLTVSMETDVLKYIK